MKKHIALAAIFSLFLFNVASAQTFSDVAHGEWYYPDIEALVQLGVINSTIEEYRPGDNVNRAEMSKMIVEAFDISMETPEFETFLDVPGSEWYFSYIETVAMYGIAIGYLDINGNLNNYFGPNDPITREQAAKMIVLGAELDTNIECDTSFPT